MIEERSDESSGAYEFFEFEDLDSAHETALSARKAYPHGAAWVEDEYGKVITTPEKPALSGTTPIASV